MMDTRYPAPPLTARGGAVNARTCRSALGLGRIRTITVVQLKNHCLIQRYRPDAAQTKRAPTGRLRKQYICLAGPTGTLFTHC